jgi:hypothetical protein
LLPIDRTIVPHVQIKIENQLLIPFGGPKWSIDGIGVVGVSTTGTYIASNTPLAHINRTERLGLRLRHFPSVVPGDWSEEIEDSGAAAAVMRDYLRDKCTLATEHERKFIDIYFDYCIEATTPSSWMLRREPTDRSAPYDDSNWIFDALLPLPQAHLYQSNPLDDKYSFVPSRMMKVDFAFWTGERLVAVEIDGGSHIGSEAHVVKDRLLQRAGVHVIHILNSELTTHGSKIIKRLLPDEITRFWKFAEAKWRDNPFDWSKPPRFDGA